MFKTILFEIGLTGTVNNQKIEIKGKGEIIQRGLYKAELEFNTLPQGFHPAAIATYTVSICCYAHAATCNGALNIYDMGADGYHTTRILKFADAGKIIIDGDVKNIDKKNATFKGSIQGNVSLPNDLSCHAMYVKKIEPHKNGIELLGAGTGTLFRNGNERTLITNIQTLHRLTPEKINKPLQYPEYRMVFESGELKGNIYKTVVHSILDTENLFLIADKKCLAMQKENVFSELF